MAARKIKPATKLQVEQVDQAIGLLRTALRQLRAAECHKPAERVNLALASAQGAQRHILRRYDETQAKES